MVHVTTHSGLHYTQNIVPLRVPFTRVQGPSLVNSYRSESFENLEPLQRSGPTMPPEVRSKMSSLKRRTSNAITHRCGVGSIRDSQGPEEIVSHRRLIVRPPPDSVACSDELLERALQSTRIRHTSKITKRVILLRTSLCAEQRLQSAAPSPQSSRGVASISTRSAGLNVLRTSLCAEERLLVSRNVLRRSIALGNLNGACRQVMPPTTLTSSYSQTEIAVDGHCRCRAQHSASEEKTLCSDRLSCETDHVTRAQVCARSPSLDALPVAQPEIVSTRRVHARSAAQYQLPPT